MKPTPVPPSQAKEMLDRGAGVVFLDARNPVAWGSSTLKLPGAVRLPLDEVDEHLRDLPRGVTAITYCT